MFATRPLSRLWLQDNLAIRTHASQFDAVTRTRQILNTTVRRKLDLVRGRVSFTDPDILRPGAGMAAVDDACEALLALLNDDTRLEYPVHVRTQALIGEATGARLARATLRVKSPEISGPPPPPPIRLVFAFEVDRG